MNQVENVEEDVDKIDNPFSLPTQQQSEGAAADNPNLSLSTKSVSTSHPPLPSSSSHYCSPAWPSPQQKTRSLTAKLRRRKQEGEEERCNYIILLKTEYCSLAGRLMLLWQGTHDIVQQSSALTETAVKNGRLLWTEMIEAFHDNSAVDSVGISTNNELLNAYLLLSSVLFAFEAGEFVGRWFGEFLLSWWLSRLCSFLTISLVIPALYVSVKSSGDWTKASSLSPSSDAVQIVEFEAAIATVIGLLHGFNVRNYPAISIIPMALVPLVQAAAVRWIVPLIGDNRDAFISVVCSQWLTPFLLLEFITGTGGVGAILLWAFTALMSSLITQLSLGSSGTDSVEAMADYWNIIILLYAVLEKSAITVLAVPSYRQIREMTENATALEAWFNQIRRDRSSYSFPFSYLESFS